MMSVAVFFCLAATLSAQTLPDGERLKNIVTTMQIGVRTDQDGLFGGSSGPYTTVFNREFNSGTVTCYPAWEAWTGYKQYNLADINDRINYLENQGQSQMMHLLVGPDMYFPDWFKNGSYTNPELDDMLHDWIKSIIQSNGNDAKVDVWNVVNEAISFSPPYEYGAAIKWQQLGYEADVSGLSGEQYVVSQHPVYIRKAFEYARQYTNAKLELRDSGAEFPDGHNSYKYHLFYQLTKHLLNKGVPLDAVGFQVHIDIERDYNWNGFRDNINRFRALGLETYITELDIGDPEESWNSTKAELQRAKYNTVIQIAMETGMEYVHFWGLIDGKDAGWRTYESPLLFDAAYNPKPAYYGVQERLYYSPGPGDNPVTVRALGTSGVEQIRLLIDDSPVTTWTLSSSMQNYTYYTGETTGNVKVEFINDTGGPDVRVDYIEADGTIYQAEDQQTNTGVWTGTCGGSYSEWLHCNGYIDFGTIQFGVIQEPWPGMPHAIPGTIQAEDYDTGGEGIACHDSDAQNSGGQYRSDGVDIETTTDSGGGFNVGWIQTGEWLEFTVDVAAADVYDIDLRVAALNSAGTCHIEFDGTDVTGPVAIPVTGGWQTFTTVSKQNVSLPAGQQVMRIVMDSDYFNMNWLNFYPHNNPPSVNITSPADGTEFTEGDNVMIYADASDADGSVTKVEFFRDGTKIGEDTSYPFSVTWNNVPQGSFTLTARATDNDGAAATSSGTGIIVNEYVAPDPNLLVNGGFENGISDWNGQGCTLSPGSTVHSGAGSVLASGRSAGWAGPMQDITSVLAANGQGDYSVSAWIKMATGSATGSITIRLISDAGTTYTLVQGPVSTDWSQVSGIATLGWSGTLTTAQLYLETTSGETTDFHADDCLLMPAMLVNGNFKDGISNWESTGCSISPSSSAHSGNGAVLASDRTASWAGPRQTITQVLAANGQGMYTLAAWMRMSSGSATGAVTVKLVDDSGTRYVNVQDPVTTLWSHVTGQLDLTWTGTLSEAQIYLETPSGSTTNFYADDCNIFPVLSKKTVRDPKPAQETRALLPATCELFQNFPNPFNPQTRLKYTIQHETVVTLRIYNIKGQMAAELVNQRQGPGEYQVIFDAHNLDSGMYFCRIQAGQFCKIIKMTFVK